MFKVYQRLRTRIHYVDGGREHFFNSCQLQLLKISAAIKNGYFITYVAYARTVQPYQEQFLARAENGRLFTF